jgi:hypothetical protein
MGEVASDLLGDDYYSVMFTAYRGVRGDPFFGSAQLRDAPSGSLEDLFHCTGNRYAFLDFRSLPPGGEWLRSPVASRPLGYTLMQADWTRVFDAVVYTETMFPSTDDGTVPSGVRTATRAEEEARVAEALEEYRKTLIGYDLDLDAVTFRQEWTAYDASRLDTFPTREAWPEVLGHVYTNPDTFKIVRGEPRNASGAVFGGAHAFVVPLEWAVTTESRATLLFLEGISSRATVVAKNHTSLICQGNLAGKLFFADYATAYVKGDLSGQISSESYFNLVVTGKFSGRILTKNQAMIYLLGGCDGNIELNHSKVYIAGRTTKADLDQIKGKGKLYLEDSDLSCGEHRIGDLVVTVAKNE